MDRSEDCVFQVNHQRKTKVLQITSRCSSSNDQKIRNQSSNLEHQLLGKL